MDSYRGTMLAVYAVAVSGFIGFPQAVFAQTAIAPDHTLPVNTLVNFNSANKTYTITGGTQVGTNQFHSFQDFSVPTANTAHFDNALTTTNVIGRVTGANISDIDGTLRTNGTANLYLINPNGVIFGNNAKLDVAGSFSASTATSIKFSDGSEFSATNPQAPPLLQINVPLGLQYGKSNPAPVNNAGNLTVGGDLTLSGGTVASVGTLKAQGNLRVDAVAGDVNLSQFQAGSATLTATQGIQLENGKFQTTGDLNLSAKDFVLIQDSGTKPLNLDVGGNLLVQGDRAVTVNTLAHPDSSLWVGRNVLLRSDNPIAIDAHWNAGGNLRVEKLNGSLGDVYSPFDPIYQVGGNFSMGSYTTTSLQILAGGSVTFNGTLRITGASPVFNNSTVILSDGSFLTINGTTRPVVDIRAGVLPSGFFSSPAITPTGLPTSSDILVPTITFSNTLAASNGLVFLTNQFAANPLLSGNIVVNAVNTASDRAAGSVVIDSKGSINIATSINSWSNSYYANGGNVNLLANGNINVASIDTSAYSNAGNISLLSRNGNIDTTQGGILAYSYYANGGNVNILANGNINVASIDTSAYSNAGNVNILANGDITVAGINATSWSDYGYYSIGGNISLLSRNGNIDTTRGDIIAYSYNYDAGKVTLKAGQDVRLGNVSSASGYYGVANDIEIDARSVSMINSKLDAGAYAYNYYGRAGNITINVTDKVSLFNSNIYSRVENHAVGNGGNISINADSVSIYSSNLSVSSILGKGNSGNVNILGRNGNVDIRTGITDTSSLFGLGGDVTLISGQDILSGNIDTSSTLSKAGNISLLSHNGNIDTSNGVVNASSLLGLGGDVTLTAWQNILSGNIDTSSLESNAGNVSLLSLNGNIDTRNGMVNAFSDIGIGGKIILTAVEDVKVGNILTFGKFGGDIAINSRSISVSNGAKLSSSAFGQGNAGNMTFTATDLVAFDGGGVFSLLESGAIGKAGDITVNSGSLSVKNGAQFQTGTYGQGNAGNINVIATDSVLFSGLGSGAFTTVEDGAVGKAGNININAKSVSVTDNAQLASSTLGQGNAGNININALDLVSFARYSAVFSDVKSDAIGNGGNVSIKARSLSITDSAQLLTDTYGQGNAGNVKIVATDSVFLSGVDANLQHSAISSSTRSNFGNGGLISVNTNSINMAKGGLIDSSTFSNKIGGNIEILAQKLDISSGSQISSAAIKSGNAGNIKVVLGQSLFLDGFGSKITTKTDANSSGNGGSISIDPPLVSITNGAEISVNSLGTGNGGSIDITAGKLIFANNALITANTVNGKGGNIKLLLSDIFFPRNNSSITTSSTVNGDGGKIVLSNLSSFLVSIPSENNDIFANADGKGAGGKIDITTQSIFGFQYRAEQSKLTSDITANSKLGTKGSVNINTLGVDPSKGLNSLPADTRDASRLLSPVCLADKRGSSFTITGKGGIAAKPSDRPTDTGVLDNFGTISPQTTNITTNPNPSTTPDRIVEATGWMRNAQNQIVLIAGETPAQTKIACP